MITTSASSNVVLFESSTVSNVVKFFEPDIQVQATMIDDTGADITLTALDSNGSPMGAQLIRLRSSELDAETMSGSGNSEQIFSIFEQAAVTYLEGLSANTGITFTIV